MTKTEWALVLAMLTLIGLSIYTKVTIWHECRQTNSFLYCLNISSR